MYSCVCRAGPPALNGAVGLSTGGAIEPPKTGGGGSGKRAQLTGPSISYYELWRQRPRKFFFLRIKIGQFFSRNIWQMISFLNPLDALIPKIPFSFLADFWVRVTSEARGLVSVGFWGSRQLSPFWGRGGASQGALSTPPPSN